MNEFIKKEGINMNSVVITGNARGFGYAMTELF